MSYGVIYANDINIIICLQIAANFCFLYCFNEHNYALDLVSYYFFEESIIIEPLCLQ
jgi:hypothetical protein